MLSSMRSGDDHKRKARNLSRTTAYGYDAASRRTSRTDAKSQTTSYSYDVVDRLTLVDYPVGTADVTFTYDALGNRATMVDGSGTTTYTRDALYRPTSIQDGGGSTVGYGYDAAGRRTSVTYPGGTEVVTYGYDNANRLTSVTDWLSKVTSYTYDNANRLTSTTLGNGLISDRAYDNADRLLTLVNRNGGITISSYTYTLDAVGNRTQRVDTLGTESYTYDARYQLTGTTYANGDVQSYTYDAMGNRTQKVHNGTPTGYSYDVADQMTLAGGVTYTYDNNGNQTAAGADTFSWDAEDRMAGTVIRGVTGTYAYNGDGLRTSRTIGGVTVTYAWDQNAGMPVILRDSAGNRYVYGLDLISRTDSGSVQEYHLADGLGSTTGLATGAGTVIDSYTYDVYGAVRTRTGTSANEFTYTGEQVDTHQGIAPGVQRLPLDQVVSSTNLTGATVANLDDDPDAPDGAWATATTVADTAVRVGFPTPPSGKPAPGAGLQEFRVQLRKNATGGNDPTYDIQLWETGGGAPLATLASGVALSSTTGTVVSVTWDAALLGQANGAAVELVIVGHRSGGGASKQRTVEVGAVEWNVNHQGTPASEFYYLRARYYDSATGRFANRDPLPLLQRYAYVGGNPVNHADPHLQSRRLGAAAIRHLDIISPRWTSASFRCNRCCSPACACRSTSLKSATV